MHHPPLHVIAGVPSRRALAVPPVKLARGIGEPEAEGDADAPGLAPAAHPARRLTASASARSPAGLAPWTVRRDRRAARPTREGRIGDLREWGGAGGRRCPRFYAERRAAPSEARDRQAASRREAHPSQLGMQPPAGILPGLASARFRRTIVGRRTYWGGLTVIGAPTSEIAYVAWSV